MLVAVERRRYRTLTPTPGLTEPRGCRSPVIRRSRELEHPAIYFVWFVDAGAHRLRRPGH